MQGYTLLDKELQNERGMQPWASGMRINLVRVTGRDRVEDWVLVYVEVQGEGKPDFP